jgi:hypothetical protein
MVVIVPVPAGATTAGVVVMARVVTVMVDVAVVMAAVVVVVAMVAAVPAVGPS